MPCWWERSWRCASPASTDGAAVSGTLRVTVTDCRGAVMGERELSCSLEEGIGDLLEWRLALAGAPGRCVIRAAFGDDEPVANETSVYLLEPSGQRLPERPPALLVDDSRLAGHLRAGGAVAAGFSPETATDLPVVVDLPAAGQEPAERFALLADWVARGGCAVLLGPPPEPLLEPAEHLGMQMSRLPAGPVLPFDLVLFPAIGTWVPCGHVVTEHACFAGLPAGVLMEQEYQNVLPQWCIVTPKSRWIGGNITCGWYRGQKHKQNFQGVSAAFDGAGADRTGARARTLRDLPVPDRTAPRQRSGRRPAAGQPVALGRRTGKIAPAGYFLCRAALSPTVAQEQQ